MGPAQPPVSPPSPLLLRLGPFGFINRLPDCNKEARKDLFHFLGFIRGILFQENLPVPPANSYEVSEASFPVQSVFHTRMRIQEANPEDRGTWKISRCRSDQRPCLPRFSPAPASLVVPDLLELSFQGQL